MLTLSSALNAIRFLSSYRPLEIHDVYLGSQTTEDEYTLHFANYPWTINFFTYISQAAQAYTPLGIGRTGVANSSNCEIDTVTYNIDDVTQGITYWAGQRTFKGKRVVTRLVFRDHLDSPLNQKVVFDGIIKKIDFTQNKTRKVSVTAAPKIGSLRQKTGWPYGLKCNAHFGDEYCKIDLNRPENTVTGLITSATATSVTISTLTQASDYWNFGRIDFLSGPSNGEARKVIDFDGVGKIITLDYDLKYLPQPGNAFRLTRGCDKTLETCTGIYSNDVNYRGFNTIPLRKDAL